VRELGTTVKIFGLEIAQGDLVHADRHGAVVIPPETVENLGAAIRRLMETEKLILEPARQPGFNFAAFEAAWSAFEKART
jgi:regulator of RNase E activity RraA